MPLGSRVAPRNGQPLLDAQHGFRIRAEGEGALAAYEENLPDDGSRHIKALLSALGDRGKELGLDTLGGFLSGLFLSGAMSGYNAAEFNRMGQEAFDTGSYRDYISLGLLADDDSEAYQYAQEIRAKLNRGRPVTNIEMGQLTASVYADALGVGEKRTEGTQERMKTYGMGCSMKRILQDSVLQE